MGGPLPEAPPQRDLRGASLSQFWGKWKSHGLFQDPMCKKKKKKKPVYLLAVLKLEASMEFLGLFFSSK